MKLSTLNLINYLTRNKYTEELSILAYKLHTCPGVEITGLVYEDQGRGTGVHSLAFFHGSDSESTTNMFLNEYATNYSGA